MVCPHHPPPKPTPPPPPPNQTPPPPPPPPTPPTTPNNGTTSTHECHPGSIVVPSFSAETLLGETSRNGGALGYAKTDEKRFRYNRRRTYRERHQGMRDHGGVMMKFDAPKSPPATGWNARAGVQRRRGPDIEKQPYPQKASTRSNPPIMPSRLLPDGQGSGTRKNGGGREGRDWT